MAGVCERFFVEKYNAHITNETLKVILPKIFSKIIDYYRDNPPLPSLQDINKLAMTRVRDFVLKKLEENDQTTSLPSFVQSSQQHIQQQMQQLSEFQIPSAPEPLGAAVETHEPVHEPVYEQHVYDQSGEFPQMHMKDGAVDEDDFRKQLQSLELQRNEGIVLNPREQLPFLQPASINPVHPIATGASPASPTIIYVPSANPKAQTKKQLVCINGEDRQWEYFKDRSKIVWNGPAPSTVSAYHLQCVMLPKHIAKSHPYVYLRINGVGNYIADVVCTLKTRGDTWDTWAPVHSEIPVMSCPWTLSLLDGKQQSVDMGNDDAVVSQADSLLGSVNANVNGNTNIRVTFENNCADVQPDDVILLKKEARVTKHIVRRVLENHKYVEITHNLLQAAIFPPRELVDSILCNLSQQFHVICEASIS
jgi:hypothetical protein